MHLSATRLATCEVLCLLTFISRVPLAHVHPGWLCVCMRVRTCVYSQVLQKPTPEQKQQLAVHSKHVAASVTELVQTAEAMKGEAAHAADTHFHTPF